MVPLGSLLTIHGQSGPVSLMRYNMYSATAITGNAAPGVSSGQATAKMAEIADRLMPRETMAREWTELAYLQEDAGNLALFIFGLAVIVRLPGAGGAVRELVAAVGGHPGGADVPALLHHRRDLGRAAK